QPRSPSIAGQRWGGRITAKVKPSRPNQATKPSGGTIPTRAVRAARHQFMTDGVSILAASWSRCCAGSMGIARAASRDFRHLVLEVLHLRFTAADTIEPARVAAQ